MNSKTMNRPIFFVLLIALASAAMAVAITHSMTRQAEQSVGRFVGEPLQKLELLSALRRDLGYGGATHHFKNYVLRGTSGLAPEIRREYGAALQEIAAYRALDISPVELNALSDLEATILAYMNNLAVAEAMRADGAAIEEIDAAVRVSDTNAVQAIGTLERVLRAELQQANAGTNEAMARLSSSSFATLILGTLAVVAIFAVFLFARSQAAELLRTNDALKHASEAKSRFLANMSHELRTPMTGVLGLISMLKAARLPEEEAEIVGHLDASGQSMLTIVNDILDISKIEAGKMELTKAPARIDSVLESVRSLFSPAAGAKGLALDFKMGEGLDQRLDIDAPRIKQILSNLVSNAVKFTDQGKIIVTASLQDDEAHFAVADSGQGIDAESLATIFESFTQAGNAAAIATPGTGLGLNISRALVELMGGRISVQSELNQGSVFSLVIPVERADLAVSSKLDAPRLPPAIPPGFEVLIVDDVATNRLVLSSVLAKYGITVVQAADGDQALEALDAANFGLVLTDIHMPVLDGLAFTRAVRRHERDQGMIAPMPIFAVTANAFSEQQPGYLEAGLDGVINKPFCETEIIDVLENAVARWSPPLAARGTVNRLANRA